MKKSHKFYASIYFVSAIFSLPAIAEESASHEEVKKPLEDASPLNTCLVKICGSASKLQNYEEQVIAGSENSLPQALKEDLKKDFKKGLSVYRNRERERLHAAKKNFEDGNFLIAPEAKIEALRLIITSNNFWEKYAQPAPCTFVEGKYLDCKIDRDKILKDLGPKLGEEQAKLIADLYSQVFSTRPLQRLFVLQSQSIYSYLLGEGTEESFEALVLREYKNRIQQLKDKGLYLRKQLNDIKDLEVIAMLEKKQNVDQSLLYDLEENRLTSLAVEELAGKGGLDDLLKKENLKALFQFSHVRENLDKKLLLLDKLKEGTEEFKQLEGIFLDGAGKGYASFPPDAEVEISSLRGRVSTLKNGLIKKLSGKYSNETLGAWGQQTIEPRSPVSKTSYIKWHRREFSFLTERSEYQGIRPVELDAYEKSSPGIALLEYSNGESATDSLTTDIEDIYKYNSFQNLDFVYKDKFDVSWFSLSSPDAGAGILCHELGHNFQKFLESPKVSAHSSGVYKSQRTCLTAQQLRFSQSDLGKKYRDYQALRARLTDASKKEDDLKDIFSPRFGEDFADAISAFSEKNVGCYLLPQFENRFIEADLENKHQDDPHSSEIFRTLLIEGQQKKALPTECTAYLNSLKFPEGIAIPKFEPCL